MSALKLVMRDHMRMSPRFLCALAVVMLMSMAPHGISRVRAQGFDGSEYIKPHFDPNRNEAGFRVGSPILRWEIEKLRVQQY